MDVERRIKRIEDTIERQRAFIYRVPDPDTRERAESHLVRLIDVRDQLSDCLHRHVEAVSRILGTLSHT